MANSDQSQIVPIADEDFSNRPRCNDPPRKLEDILRPDGQTIGEIFGRARPLVRTVTDHEFGRIMGELLKGAQEINAPLSYAGKYFIRKDGTIFGVRNSLDSGATIDIVEPGTSGTERNFKVHRR